MDYEVWQWALIAVASFIIGLSKCGVPGLGILSVAIFQNVLLAKDATGFALPILIAGDLCAVLAYRRHADWSQLGRLMPWTAVGVVCGYFAMAIIDDRQARVIIGSILAVMLILHALKSKNSSIFDPSRSRGRLFAPVAGLLAGFVSLVAHAAGPVMIIYLLAMRLPKMVFLGTSVMFFTLMNAFKVPFLAHLNLINFDSLSSNLRLIPFVVAGGAAGYFFAKQVSQKWFERIAFWLTVGAVLHMLWIAFV